MRSKARSSTSRMKRKLGCSGEEESLFEGARERAGRGKLAHRSRRRSVRSTGAVIADSEHRASECMFKGPLRHIHG